MRYLREPQLPYGPGHIGQPAFVEMISSSRCGARSRRRIRPNVFSADPGGGP